MSYKFLPPPNFHVFSYKKWTLGKRKMCLLKHRHKILSIIRYTVLYTSFSKGKKLLHCSRDVCLSGNGIFFSCLSVFSYSISSSKLDFRMIRLKDIAQVKKNATYQGQLETRASIYYWSVSITG